MRRSGVLLSISSIPSNYGIGTFGEKAYEFVDLLKKGGQSYWQILPLGPTSYGDSPYQSFSTFAGNPYFIDLDILVEEGLLTREECEACDWGENPAYVDYEKVYESRFLILRKAFERSQVNKDASYQQFVSENAFWLDDYALFMAVKKAFSGEGFASWDDDIKKRSKTAVEKYTKKYKDEIEFYKFQQFKFSQQWKQLKTYANKKGIQIIGDIPIYVAFDSADTWANPELFEFDEDMNPLAVAGCPPDAFSKTGQLWGNPLYRWDYHKKTNYDWWIQRIEYCYTLYDVVRIDHFRGFDEYYAIPYGHLTAEKGKWEKGPGYELFQVMKDRLGKKQVIAEDLGFLTDGVRKLVKKTGYPGMKILQFAFDSREESDYLPHNFDKNCVVYTGTHDNDTSVGWWKTFAKKDKAFAKKYMNVKGSREIHWILIRACMASVAETAIIPMQDYLGLGSEARMNTPSTLGENWKWRLLDGQFEENLAERMNELTKTYYRI